MDVNLPGDPGAHEPLQFRLVEHVRLRETVLADFVRAAELRHHPVPGVEQPQPAARPRPGQELLGHADPPQDPRDLIVEVDGTGQGMRAGVAFEQGDGNTEVREQDSCSAADGPAPTTSTLGVDYQFCYSVSIMINQSVKARGYVYPCAGVRLD
jgi:hypothetical protein